jgi:exodeoxyribonuclease V alpha subunit
MVFLHSHGVGTARAVRIFKTYGSDAVQVMTENPYRLARDTGVTRGKRLVVLVGQKKAVAIAVRNVSGRRRWSKLAEWLRPISSVTQRAVMTG